MSANERHERLFRFKQFSVCHRRSSMKVGVDGVLVGAWANVDCIPILDAGCGCGLMALMVAQRNSNAQITGVDIEAAAIDEAIENAKASPWAERITFRHIGFKDFIQSAIDSNQRFGTIISNPPFFRSGVNTPATPRERSRHCAELCPEMLITNAPHILLPGGALSMITPPTLLPYMHLAAENADMHCHRLTYVYTVEGKQPKRILSEWRSIPGECHIDTLNIKNGTYPDYHFSPEYIRLCAPFYLHMQQIDK